jgi:hypothetical protein
MGYYDVGDRVRLSGEFTDEDGNLHDPTAVYVTYTDPNGTETVLQYGVDVEVIRNAEGQYHVDIDVDEVGRWPYEWYATGTGRSRGTARLIVKSDAR